MPLYARILVLLTLATVFIGAGADAAQAPDKNTFMSQVRQFYSPW